jgi:hypothetical protein
VVGGIRGVNPWWGLRGPLTSQSLKSTVFRAKLSNLSGEKQTGILKIILNFGKLNVKNTTLQTW